MFENEHLNQNSTELCILYFKSYGVEYKIKMFFNNMVKNLNKICWTVDSTGVTKDIS